MIHERQLDQVIIDPRIQKQYQESTQRYLKAEIADAKIPPRIIDYLAPSRENCSGFVWSTLDKCIYSSDSASYAILYPWGAPGIPDFAANVFSTGIRGTFAEVSANGSFRFYVPMYSLQNPGNPHPAVEKLYSHNLEDQADYALLQLQALKYISYLKKGDFTLKDGRSSEGLLVNKHLVNNS